MPIFLKCGHKSRGKLVENNSVFCILIAIALVKHFPTLLLVDSTKGVSSYWLSHFPGNAEDDEPDKIAIAFGRFGRFKRFIVGSVKGFFLFIKNKVVQLFTGRRSRYDEDTFEVDEKVGERKRLNHKIGEF